MVQWTISSDERRELKRAAVGSKFAPANFGEGSCRHRPDPSPKNPSLRSEFFDPPSRGGSIQYLTFFWQRLSDHRDEATLNSSELLEIGLSLSET
jgi:hypothetical protein